MVLTKVATRVAPVLLLGVSGIAMAQATTAADLYPTIDDLGVNVVSGSFNISVPQIAGRTLETQRQWGQFGWVDRWTGGLQEELVDGTRTITINLGQMSEVFKLASGVWQSQKADGGTLVRTTDGYAAANYVYRTADGIEVRFVSMGREVLDPYSNNAQSVSVNGSTCSADDQPPNVRTQFCAAPTSVIQPSGEALNLEWVESDPQCIPIGGAVGWACTVQFRVSRISSSRGPRLSYEYNYPATEVARWRRPTSMRYSTVSAPDCADNNVSGCLQTTALPSVQYNAPSNNVDEITDDQGRFWRFSRDASNRWITAIQRPGESSPGISIQYDAVGRVTSFTRDGTTRTYTWSTQGSDVKLVTSDVVGTRTIISNPTVGRPISVTNGTGNTTAYAYDANGRLTNTTLPEGNVLSSEYDARGNVTLTRAHARAGTGL
jgi:YD repeat-containing protein